MSKIDENFELGVPIEWEIPENITPRYTTHMVIQHLENENLISFFEVIPPIMLGDKESIKQIKKVTARCICQVIVADNKLPEIVSVLQNHCEKNIIKPKNE